MRDAQSFGQQIKRQDAPRKVLRGTVFEAGAGTAGVELPDGVRLRRVATSGTLAVGDVVDVELSGGRARILTAGEVTAGGAISSSVSGTGMLFGAPSPHDLLGSHHTLPTLSQNLFLASPISSSGVPSFRAIGAADLPGQFAGFANPTALAGMTAINGTATTAMRSDAAPAINPAITPTWTGLHTFNAGATIAAGQNLNFGADVSLSRLGADVLGLGSGDSFRSPNYVSGVAGWSIDGTGDAEFNNITARGELRAFVFKINELSATAGTFGVFYSASTAWADFTTASSLSGSFTFRAKNSDAGGMLFGMGDILRTKAWNGAALVDAWFTITARTNETDRTLYTATLNSGSTSATIREGTAIVDYGPSGTGAITLSTDGTVGSTPNITLFKHAGAPWSTITPLMRIGNLNGYGSFATNTYGIAMGEPTGAWMTLEGNAIRLKQSSTDVIVLDGATGNSSFAGVISIGTSGGIYQGSGTFASPTTGLKIFNSSGIGIIAGYNSGTVQWQAGTDGRLYAGAQKVMLSAAGITVASPQTAGVLSAGDPAVIEWRESTVTGGLKGRIYTTVNSAQGDVWIDSAVGTLRMFSRVTIGSTNGIDTGISIGFPDIANSRTGTITIAGKLAVSGVTIDGTASRNYFKDSETVSAGLGGNGLRVGTVWNMYGIYSESGPCAVGGEISGNHPVVVRNGLVVENYNYAAGLTPGIGAIIAGSISHNYTPTSGTWSAQSTLLLNAQDYSTIGFHDSGSRVDFIRVGAGVMTLGYDGGFGAAAIYAPNKITSDTSVSGQVTMHQQRVVATAGSGSTDTSLIVPIERSCTLKRWTVSFFVSNGSGTNGFILRLKTANGTTVATVDTRGYNPGGSRYLVNTSLSTAVDTSTQVLYIESEQAGTFSGTLYLTSSVFLS